MLKQGGDGWRFLLLRRTGTETYSGTCGVKPGDTEPVIACLDEADVNASAPAEITCDDISIGDISLLVDYLFITGPTAWDDSKVDEFNGYFITGVGKLRPCP